MKSMPIENPIFTIPNVLSKAECNEYIALTENIGYTAAGLAVGQDEYIMAPSLRNNDRVIMDNPELAASLWRRVETFVPRIDNWRAIGLNERLRFYRYDPGQRFAPHCDSSYWRTNRDHSRLTFMIYLNEDFEGGETRFYSPDVCIVPKSGMALLFMHELKHEGVSVLQGRKYVVRSDVMYTYARKEKSRKVDF
ncbi:2OG-Fe(II) oxygenase [Coleofasciculus sp. FACHB-1120]|uniref:prolyl hydroxylase family protein n=1 Tax=Coleofasciculus sp. FACHB-1120 TaxID=2692783 RepID=UPI001687C318|nr:2OG-Fe(II) oxygenase [Coleofasciculus sp. FACHB-1120]MBD2741310.1 2OG-Fe(II) oxygenase [Coleofasciculus sp. FACHB-1120]